MLKSKNLSNFDTTEARLSFLTFDAKTVFNCLWLAFTKTPIFCHFDLKCYIQIKIDVLNYTISGVLNQLTFKTSSNEVFTKINLSQ